ncbi:hypothetical protein CY0110_16522 [Crocosphaera chwakensis CCY0110]|uniref:Uncharacterized protein n=1 Tax=Crocosphaera chwakensis CCY0110 TaxID=391612 RepID=A3IHY6_9CHRO|nr:hypothetical protein CY0110_16522 [Crocosphaera chwakensis CCY0110]
MDCLLFPQLNKVRSCNRPSGLYRFCVLLGSLSVIFL